MTIRFATASSDSVKDPQALVSAYEGLLIIQIARAVNDFRQDWIDVKMTNAEAVQGRVILEPFAFAAVVHAFGHKTLKDTVDYITAVATSAGALDASLNLKARVHRKPAGDPLQAAQYGNAYVLIIHKSAPTHKVQEPRLPCRVGALAFLGYKSAQSAVPIIIGAEP